MAINLYIPGLENHPSDFKVVEYVLEKQEIGNVVNFYHDGRKPGRFFKTNVERERVIDSIIDRFNVYAGDNDVNIIAQSSGCNEAGIILGKLSSTPGAERIRGATLMSPEYVPAPGWYVDDTAAESFKKYGILNEFPNTLGFWEKIKLYKYHTDLRYLSLWYLLKSEIPMQFIICDGDKNVYHENVVAIADVLKRELVLVESQYHNPLMSNDSKKVAEKIKCFTDINKRR
jgi:hypothetical protein